MSSPQSNKRTLNSWSAISPETFNLTVRRIFEPSAEAKLQAALDDVLSQIAESKTGPQAAQREYTREAIELKKKKEKLERRIAKLQELKKKAIGPLIISLFIGVIVWVTILALGAGAIGGTTYAIQQAIAKDMENIKENQATSLTIEEVDSDVHAGQLMGVPDRGDGEFGSYVKESENGDYPEPAYLLEVTFWEAELDGCDTTLATVESTEEIAGCVAAARIELVNTEDPAITQACVLLQLGDEDATTTSISSDEQLEWARASQINTVAEKRNKVTSYLAGDEDSWNSTTLLSCQVSGTDDETLAREMSYIVGQLVYRINSQAYLAGGIFTWLEADGSYAPMSVWDGHRPMESESELGE